MSSYVLLLNSTNSYLVPALSLLKEEIARLEKYQKYSSICFNVIRWNGKKSKWYSFSCCVGPCYLMPCSFTPKIWETLLCLIVFP